MHLVIILFALFSSIFTLQKDTLQYCEPFFLIGFRMTFAGILLLSYVKITQKTITLKLKHLISFIILALFAFYLTNTCEIWGTQHMVSSKVCLLYSLTPFCAAFVAFFVLGERLTAKKWLGMIIGLLGLIPIHYTQTFDEITGGTFLTFSLAELSVLGAVIFSVYGWILLKKIISEYQQSPLLANGVAMLIGGILALGHSYLSGEHWQPIPVTEFKPFILNSLAMCLISNIICYNLYGFLLKRFTATFMAFAGLISPFFASLYGYIFLQETISWHFATSILIFSIGLYIFYQEEIKQGQAYRISPATT